MFKISPFLTQSRLRFVVEPDPNAGGSTQQQQEDDGGTHIPVRERTPEEQIEFHQAKARRLEETLKKFKGTTPETLEEIIRERDELKQKTQTEVEKAVEAAREEGRNEYRNLLGRERVKIALSTALTGRVVRGNALLDFDASKFLKGDTADGDAIKDWVENNTDPASAGTRRDIDLGQGRRGGGQTASKGVTAGRDLFDSTLSRSRKE